MVDRTKMQAHRKRVKAEEQMARAREQLQKAQRAVKDAKAVEAHRNHHLCATGAEWYRLDLRAEHVPALAAMWSRPLPMFVAALRNMSDAAPDKSVGELLAEYVLRSDEALSLEGDRIVLQREVTAYLKNCDNWLERQSDPSARQDWRANKITTPQAWLIERTCDLLDLLDRPSPANCGEAHDWLSRMRANLRLNLASVNKSIGAPAPQPASVSSGTAGRPTMSSDDATHPQRTIATQPPGSGLLPLDGEGDHA